MAIFDVHVLVQAILYLSAFVTGFVICIPVGVNRINFNGKCILYAHFDWKNKTSFKMTGSSQINCNFPIYFCVFGCIFYGLGVGLYNAYAVIKSTKDTSIGSQMWVMPFILINTLVGFTTFIVACMLSVGFKQFCDGVTQSGFYKRVNILQRRTKIDNRASKGTPVLGLHFLPVPILYAPCFKLITVLSRVLDRSHAVYRMEFLKYSWRKRIIQQFDKAKLNADLSNSIQSDLIMMYAAGHSCAGAEKAKWVDLENGNKFSTGPYFKLLTVAQTAAWLCFLFWTIQVVMCILRFVRNRRQRSAQMFNAAQKSETSTDTAKIAELTPTA